MMMIIIILRLMISGSLPDSGWSYPAIDYYDRATPDRQPASMYLPRSKALPRHSRQVDNHHPVTSHFDWQLAVGMLCIFHITHSLVTYLYLAEMSTSSLAHWDCPFGSSSGHQSYHNIIFYSWLFVLVT